jgi:hypothetical protein
MLYVKEYRSASQSGSLVNQPGWLILIQVGAQAKGEK